MADPAIARHPLLGLFAPSAPNGHLSTAQVVRPDSVDLSTTAGEGPGDRVRHDLAKLGRSTRRELWILRNFLRFSWLGSGYCQVSTGTRVLFLCSPGVAAQSLPLVPVVPAQWPGVHNPGLSGAEVWWLGLSLRTAAQGMMVCFHAVGNGGRALPTPSGAPRPGALCCHRL
jgi:hypothetical protein